MKKKCEWCGKEKEVNKKFGIWEVCDDCYYLLKKRWKEAKKHNKVKRKVTYLKEFEEVEKKVIKYFLKHRNKKLNYAQLSDKIRYNLIGSKTKYKKLIGFLRRMQNKGLISYYFNPYQRYNYGFWYVTEENIKNIKEYLNKKKKSKNEENKIRL